MAGIASPPGFPEAGTLTLRRLDIGRPLVTGVRADRFARLRQELCAWCDAPE
jgi:hypothetical protein